MCADAIATIEGISRQELDRQAFESQQKAARAIAEGRFDKSLVPVYDVGGNLVLDKEQFPRPKTTLEKLAELEPPLPIWLTFRWIMQGQLTASCLTRSTRTWISSISTTPETPRGLLMAPARCCCLLPGYAKAQGWKPRARDYNHG